MTKYLIGHQIWRLKEKRRKEEKKKGRRRRSQKERERERERESCCARENNCKFLKR